MLKPFSQIFNLVVQRDQAIAIATGRANLEIAQTSRQIAEATMRDSAAMRTIAILTMIFLPGTAVAVSRSGTYLRPDYRLTRLAAVLLQHHHVQLEP